MLPHHISIASLVLYALSVQFVVDGVTFLGKMQLRGIVFFVNLFGGCKLLVHKRLDRPRVHAQQ